MDLLSNSQGGISILFRSLVSKLISKNNPGVLSSHSGEGDDIVVLPYKGYEDNGLRAVFIKSQSEESKITDSSFYEQYLTAEFDFEKEQVMVGGSAISLSYNSF